MAEIARFQLSHYEEVMALWQRTEGLTLRAVDSREGLARHLDRNPGLSFLALDEGRIIGAVLGGHDGRRGYLHHLAVAPSHRRRGLGRALSEQVLGGLSGEGIVKCHLFVHANNVAARAFWQHLGWVERTDLVLVSHTDPAAPDA
jgi:N-acetylglutamate synthase